MRKTTGTLNRILNSTKPEEIEGYLDANSEEMIDGGHPFSRYMKACIRNKGLTQQEVFIRADFSESYGYKILSEEKHTRQRDTILRLCIGAGMDLEETQRALKIYGMSPLYARVPRDALIMTILNGKSTDIAGVSEVLTSHGFDSLRGTETE